MGLNISSCLTALTLECFMEYSLTGTSLGRLLPQPRPRKGLGDPQHEWQATTLS